MNLRATSLLFLVLVLLAGLALFLQRSREQELTATGDVMFPEFDMETADRLELHRGTIEVILAKRDGRWMVESDGGKPADPSLVQNILDKLADLRRSDLVSKQEERHSVFETDTSGVEVKIETAGRPTAWFIVGKGGNDFMSNYVRLHDEERVYRVPVYLRSYVDRGDATWRNKLVLDLSEDDIASYTTRTPRDTVTVQRAPDGTWAITQPFEAPASADLMPVILRSLARVSASDFADSLSDLSSVGLAQDTMSVSVTTTAGETIRVRIGAQTESRQFYTQREGFEDVYLVPAGRWNTIFRDAEEVRTMTRAEPGGAGATP